MTTQLNRQGSALFRHLNGIGTRFSLMGYDEMRDTAQKYLRFAETIHGVSNETRELSSRLDRVHQDFQSSANTKEDRRNSLEAFNSLIYSIRDKWNFSLPDSSGKFAEQKITLTMEDRLLVHSVHAADYTGPIGNQPTSLLKETVDRAAALLEKVDDSQGRYYMRQLSRTEIFMNSTMLTRLFGEIRPKIGQLIKFTTLSGEAILQPN